MKKHYFFMLVATVCCAIGFVSCGSDDFFDVNETSLSVNANGESKSFLISTNLDWSVISSESWVKISPSSGSGDMTVTVTAEKNETTTKRTAILTASSSKGSHSIQVTQESATPYFKVSSSSLSFDKNSGSQQLTIETNVDWSVSSSDPTWLTVSPSSGNSITKTVNVIVSKNETAEERSALLTFSTSNAGSQSVTVKQNGESSFTVTPLRAELAADEGASTTVVVTSNSNWTISGIPSWLSLSASQGGIGVTSVIITAKEKNYSEKTRTVNLTIQAGKNTLTIPIIQAAMFDSTIKVTAVNELILSDGYYADLNFSNVLGYHEGYYYKYAFQVKTEEDIYKEVKDGEVYSSEVYDYTMLPGLSPNTEYVYCCVPYSGSGNSRKYGKMLIKNFTTKSSTNYCDASVSASNNEYYWTYTITKQRRCHHYYQIYAYDIYAEYCQSQSSIFLAKEIRDRINDKVNYPNYDYYLNDGTYRITRTSGDYAFFIWTWGVDDNGDFSGNISTSYKNTSSEIVVPSFRATPNKELKSVKKLARSEWNKMRKYLYFEQK